MPELQPMYWKPDQKALEADTAEFEALCKEAGLDISLDSEEALWSLGWRIMQLRARQLRETN